MKKFSVWLSAAVFLAMTGLATVAVAGPEGAPLKVGVVLPLTGAYQKFGEIQKNAFLMGTNTMERGQK